MSVQELLIDHIGAQGDGVALTPDGPVFVPYALPSELISADIERSRGKLIDILKKSDARILPKCDHFGTCGGCATQHMSENLYQNWKLALAQSALEKAAIDYTITSYVPCEPGARRRVTFSAERTAEGLSFGFYQDGTHHMTPIEMCVIASSNIQNAIVELKELAQTLAPASKRLQLTVLDSDNGLDIALSDDVRLQDNAKQAAIRKIMASKSFIRLSQGDEILIEKQAPALIFGDTQVQPPAGSFVQASQQAEQHMVKLVNRHLKSCKKVADLFSGCGTFTFPLALKSAVHAVEAQGTALHAIDKAFRNRQGLKPVTTERRDLFRRPMMRDELKHYKGVIFDPPRAGAELQSQQLARSTVPKIAAVSCNPISFARDLKILLDGSFKIKSIVAIDQFLWSPHVELVALLER